MDESTTRRKKIDPALYAVGWEQVPESEILNEQRAYEIAPGRVEKLKARRPKKVDYILEYKGLKLAVIEAKSDETDVAIAVPQAKLYAESEFEKYRIIQDKLFQSDFDRYDTNNLLEFKDE